MWLWIFLLYCEHFILKFVCLDGKNRKYIPLIIILLEWEFYFSMYSVSLARVKKKKNVFIVLQNVWQLEKYICYIFWVVIEHPIFIFVYAWHAGLLFLFLLTSPLSWSNATSLWFMYCCLKIDIFNIGKILISLFIFLYKIFKSQVLCWRCFLFGVR